MNYVAIDLLVVSRGAFFRPVHGPSRASRCRPVVHDGFPKQTKAGLQPRLRGFSTFGFSRIVQRRYPFQPINGFPIGMVLPLISRVIDNPR